MGAGLGQGIDERVDALLAQMTLEEKLAQLGSAWVYQILAGKDLDREKAQVLMGHGIGQITRLAGASSLAPAECARLANQIQRYLVEETRLGIPAIIHEECCAGYLARSATCFPQIIGAASTWEPELVNAMTTVIRTQMRAVGAHQGLAPVLDVARDPRWGRTEETFGEDPYLIATMGVAYIQGLQGDDLAQGVAATAKHFVGYAASLGGLNWGPAHIPARELHEVYLAPFKAAVRTAKVASLMNAYHELDGIPCGASHDLLTGLLRDEWGFNGVVVSDYMAVNQLADYHHYAAGKADAARMALEAGIDVELPNTDGFGAPLLEAVRSSALDEAVVDEAVRRHLRLKFRLGLFERPYVDEDAVAAVFDTVEQRGLARRIARKSMVLLKNEGKLLPLAKDTRTIAVIGPNADDVRNLLGDYSYPAHIETLIANQGRGLMDMPLPDSLEMVDNFVPIISVLDAIRQKATDGMNVLYAQGCEVLGESQAGFAEAVAAAKAADVAIVVVGDKAGLTPDCSSGEFRDRATLGLPGVQEELLRAVSETGTPVVLVLVNGRPFALSWAAAHVPAILEAWLPGEEGAVAIAEVLFGEVNPGGKLPVTLPRSVGQVPLYYNHKPSGARSFPYGPYVDEDNTPLYPFGFGLSYTQFAFSNLHVGPAEVGVDGVVEVSVEVRNTGDRTGDEVVQVYTATRGASVTRPVQELRAFQRVELAAGEAQTVTLHVPVAQMAYYDRDMRWGVEPTTVEVMVGSSARDIHLRGEMKIKG